MRKELKKVEFNHESTDTHEACGVAHLSEDTIEILTNSINKFASEIAKETRANGMFRPTLLPEDSQWGLESNERLIICVQVAQSDDLCDVLGLFKPEARSFTKVSEFCEYLYNSDISDVALLRMGNLALEIFSCKNNPFADLMKNL